MSESSLGKGKEWVDWAVDRQEFIHREIIKIENKQYPCSNYGEPLRRHFLEEESKIMNEMTYALSELLRAFFRAVDRASSRRGGPE